MVKVVFGVKVVLVLPLLLGFPFIFEASSRMPEFGVQKGDDTQLGTHATVPVSPGVVPAVTISGGG